MESTRPYLFKARMKGSDIEDGLSKQCLNVRNEKELLQSEIKVVYNYFKFASYIFNIFPYTFT
jgi:hypothetical protein